MVDHVTELMIRFVSCFFLKNNFVECVKLILKDNLSSFVECVKLILEDNLSLSVERVSLS